MSCRHARSLTPQSSQPEPPSPPCPENQRASLEQRGLECWAVQPTAVESRKQEHALRSHSPPRQRCDRKPTRSECPADAMCAPHCVQQPQLADRSIVNSGPSAHGLERGLGPLSKKEPWTPPPSSDEPRREPKLGIETSSWISLEISL